jgi:hypothetical protein
MNRKRKTFAAALMPTLLLLTAGEGAARTTCAMGHYRCTQECIYSGYDGPECRNRCLAFHNKCFKIEGTRPELDSKWPVASQPGRRLPGGGILDGGPGFGTRAPAATGSPLTGGSSPGAGNGAPMLR